MHFKNFHNLKVRFQVTLVYHTQLDDSWSQAARKLQEELKKIRPSSPLDVIGRAKNQKIAVDRDFVLERIPVGGRELVYKQVPHYAQGMI